MCYMCVLCGYVCVYVCVLSTEIGGMAKITEACDWWSLGALLYELLTGMVKTFAFFER